jgi:hypothetical protein
MARVVVGAVVRLVSLGRIVMSAKIFSVASCFVLSIVSLPAWGADTATVTDLRRAVPADVHMAVYAKRNPERDYQREYLEEAWETVQEEQIGERIVKIIGSRIPEDKKDDARERWAEIREALEPISGEALANAEEFVFAQRMVGMFNQQLFALRLSEEDAADCEGGMTEVFELAEKWSDGKVSVEETEVDDATVTTLRLPKEAPFQPGVARVGDVILFSTGPELLRDSVEQLQSDSGVSKFDDPRFKEAMEHLPEAEDVVTFFDAKQMFKSMADIGDVIREKGRNEEKAERGAKLMERILSEVAILDYEVTVEYTEDGQNRSKAIGKLADGYEDMLLGKALTQGEAFEDWKSWIPADATSFSLNTGLNLHVLYEGIMEIVREDIPESKRGLEKFAEAQEKVDVNLDEDIFQSFSGECVSVRLPVEVSDDKTVQQGVTALKCSNPERIRELLDRAVEALNKLPAVQAQELELVDAEDLDGYQEIKANIFSTVGVRPVIGFDDDWMIVSSHIEAAKKFAAVRAGDEDSIADSDKLEDFDVESDGEVYAASYCDVGAGVRQAADFIDKAGMMAPMFIGMAAAKADPEDMKPVQEAIALLPSIAKVVRKFDYFEDRLSITREGPLPDSYIREAATQIRQPEDES